MSLGPTGRILRLAANREAPPAGAGLPVREHSSHDRDADAIVVHDRSRTYGGHANAVCPHTRANTKAGLAGRRASDLVFAKLAPGGEARLGATRAPSYPRVARRAAPTPRCPRGHGCTLGSAYH